MNQSNLYASNGPDESHSFASQFVVGLALIVAIAVILWVLTDPAAALLTVTAVGAAGVLVVGTTDVLSDGENGSD